MPKRGVLFALAAAVLFGASTPFAKLLVRDIGPMMLAALLYLGAGIALAATRFFPGDRDRAEARLRIADLPLIAGVVFFGGILGPILMLWGLERVSGVLGSLLLNLEAPSTILLGVVFFGDHMTARAAVASASIIAGASLLSGIPSGLEADPIGALAIAGACASWGLDNNLTQRLSLRDPVAVARTKALAAGATMFVLAVVRGDPLVGPQELARALVLGAIAYGASLVFAVQAMRILGAARQAMFFASAPFVGAMLAVPLLGERPGPEVAAAGLLIAGGLLLLFRERHAHSHTHQEIEHDHAHVHDVHHQHAHTTETPLQEPHSHPHRHSRFTHSHAHVPDLHHRHQH